MQDQQYDGVVLEDKWGKSYLCSSCLLAYADLGEDSLADVKDTEFGRYFLHDLEPSWDQRNIWAQLYQHARPWATDLSKLNKFQLRDALLQMFARDEMRIWQLTDGWGKAPEGNGIGDGGLAPAASGGTSPAPAAKASKPKGGGATAEQPVAAKTATHEVSNSSSDTSNLNSDGLSVDDVKLAKSAGATPEQIAARERVSRQFLESNGFSDSQIANAIGDKAAGIEGGVDLTKPVEVISFPPPDQMTQYVKSHGFPGNWFDPTSEQSPDELGLSGEGRVLKSFKMPKSKGLLSRSKPIVDTWTNPSNPVSTAGGGKQLFVNDGTKTAVISLNKIGG